MKVTFEEIFKKGGTYFLYYLLFAVIGIIFVGAGGAVIGAGSVMAIDSASPGLGSIVGGMILMIIGQVIMAIGMFGVAYKIVVEGVWRAEEGEQSRL